MKNFTVVKLDQEGKLAAVFMVCLTKEEATGVARALNALLRSHEYCFRVKEETYH